MTGQAIVLRGDARQLPLPDESVDLIVTSPPYWALRSYTDAGEHYNGQLGSEATPAEWLDALLDCTREMVRVLKPSGSLFVDLGDKYSDRAGPTWAGSSDRLTGRPPKPRRSSGTSMAPRKSLLLLPERYRIACVDELGLLARAVLVWDKPNGLPERVTDRVRRSHEDWVHLTKQPTYFGAVDEIRQPHTGGTHLAGANAAVTNWETGAGQLHRTGRSDPERFHPMGKLPGSVWTIASEPLTVPEHLGVDHFAAFPSEWPRRLILGWSPTGICSECGEGRRPVVDIVQELTGHTRTVDSGLTTQEAVRRPGGFQRAGYTSTRSAASINGYWCACPSAAAPARPAIVLDPFGGTGTTAMVAKALGRVGISIDLSADYCRLARWRINHSGHDAKVRARTWADRQGALAL